MKNFAIRVTQKLKGYYDGTIEVKAKNEQDALEKLKKMPKKEIDEKADWTHGDEYDADTNSIEIDEDSINEV